MPILRCVLVRLASPVVLAAAVLGQCDLVWGSASPRLELLGAGSCSVLWDPDGAGPAPLNLVVGGTNLVTGAGALPGRVAAFDGSRWALLGNGPGTTGSTSALAVWNGQLIAGGSLAGGGIANIAAWNGSGWQPLGSGFPTAVSALTVWNGNLVAGGTMAGPMGGGPLLQLWNGSVWTPLPPPPTTTTVQALTVYLGQLVVGGSRPSPTNGVLERWNGTSWSPSILASPSQGAWIDRLAVRKDLAIGGADTLYVGGYFAGVGGVAANSIAKTNAGGFAWSNVGGNNNASCTALHVRTVGATGTTVTAGFGFPSSAWQFSSASGTWTQLGNPPVASFELYGGSYHATQSVSPAAANPACVRYNGAAWVAAIGQGIVGEVRALAAVGDGVFVGGAFGPSSTLPLHGIARWNGTAFEALGTGVSGSSVDALLQRATGELVAGGAFTAAGGTPAGNIARWTGSTWSTFGAGTDQQVLALCELPNGDLIAGGRFTLAGGVTCNRIARWDGNSWSAIGLGFNGDVMALAVRSDGVLFAAGAFTFAAATPCNRIARWDGLQWQPLGSGTNGDVHALAFRPNGDLIAAGAFAQAGAVVVDRCARWDGVVWTSTGAASGDATPARSLLVLSTGDVVAGRGFHQATAALDAGIARWNGSTWAGIGAGLATSPAGSPVAVRALAQRRDGTIFVGGSFGLAGGGLVARGLATLTPSCPALATAVGVGCSSAAGPLSLTADTLPWAGTTLRTTTAGVPATALCLGVAGFTPLSIPLPALLPEGQAGCSLLASLDVLSFVPNGPGDTAQSVFAVPSSASLVGVSFLQQSVPLEFGVGGALAAVRSSNALTLTIGAL